MTTSSSDVPMRHGWAIVATAVAVSIACGGPTVPVPPGDAVAAPDATPTTDPRRDGGVDLLDGFRAEQTLYLERDASTTGTALYWARKEGTRATVLLGHDASGALVGVMTDDGGTATPVGGILTADATIGTWLEFRRAVSGGWEHYRLRIVDGTAVGRYAQTASAERPALTAFDRHVTGWLAEAFPLDLPSLSWDVALGDARHARIRIARGASGAWSGRFKIYAGASMPVGPGAEERFDPSGELLEEDVDLVTFDGMRLSLARSDGSAPVGSLVSLDATVTERKIAGNARLADGSLVTIAGARSALMSFGFEARSDRDAWQTSTRRRIANLLMNGNPLPASACTTTLGSPRAPFPAMAACAGVNPNECPKGFVCEANECLPTRRDDDQANHPQSYTLQEITLSCPMSNPFDGASITVPRAIHGWVSTPTTPKPEKGFPVVFAINGHGATAASVMSSADPTGLFHYGDAFARRGFVVVAIDVKHHPDEAVDGEGGTHPPIVGDAFATSDWEEDGERIWDLMRATDWARARSDVDRSRFLATGLSMGGEEATLLAALDPRIALAIPAGYSPDMDVLLAMGGHNCWQWRYASIHEYVDQADLHALIAPRALLVQTGKQDVVFSSHAPPYSSDLQVMRRSRAAWSASEGTRVNLYLHYDEHAYHFGDRRAGESVGLGVAIAPPTTGATSSPAWQTQPTTTTLAPTLFDVIAESLR
jgi:hypothetical protein